MDFRFSKHESILAATWQMNKAIMLLECRTIVKIDFSEFNIGVNIKVSELPTLKKP